MIAASSGATRVAVGRDHACAVVAGGLVCWGNQTAGALGNGATSGYTTPVQSVSAGAGITAVAAGDSFNGAYIAARLSGADPEPSARAGNRMAAKVIRHKGALLPFGH